MRHLLLLVVAVEQRREPAEEQPEQRDTLGGGTRGLCGAPLRPLLLGWPPLRPLLFGPGLLLIVADAGWPTLPRWPSRSCCLRRELHLEEIEIELPNEDKEVGPWVSADEVELLKEPFESWAGLVPAAALGESDDEAGAIV